MPYLTKKFIHDVSDTSKQEWTYEKTSNEIITMNASYIQDRREYTSFFYNDLKSLLEQTDLSIIFDDDNFIFNIFDLDIIVRCFDTCPGGLESASRYNGIRPYIILPRNSNITNNNSMYNLTSFSNSSFFSSSNSAEPGLKKWESIIESSTYTKIHYNLKLWYNTNFIMCNLVSAYGYEMPLFCFIQGELARDKNIKPVYLSANINTKYNSCTYHSITIPGLNTDKTQYINYLSHLAYDYPYTIDNNENFLTDDLYYPSQKILIKLSNDNTSDDIYMQNMTSFGGIIKYDNVFNITRHNTDGLKRQFEKKMYYNINEETYYYPGFSDGMNEEANRQFIFKL